MNVRHFHFYNEKMTTIQLPTKALSVPKLKHWLLILLVTITPSLVSYLLITVGGNHINDFMPRWSDEVSYWTQINTFRQVGLNGGYFTIKELAPPAEFTHFYTYGPWYPGLYGTIARFIGWSSTTILFINTLLIGLALMIFCVAARLDERQLLMTILMLATMWGLLLYLFTGMQEAYQQTLAVLLASMFVIALREREKISTPYKWVGMLLIAFAAVMRLSWAILFVPFLVLTSKKTIRYWITNVVISLLATLIVMLFANYTGAPGNNSIFDMVTAFRISLGEGLNYFVQYFAHNLGRLLFLSKLGTDVLQTYQVVGLIIALSAFALQLYLHRKRKSPLRAEALFHLYNLAVTVLAACALYIIGTGGDYRLLACHFMISLLLLIAFKRYRPVLMIAAINIVFVFTFLGDFQGVVISKYDPDHTAYITFKQVAGTNLHYDSRTTNAWCNTLLFAVKYYDGPSLVGTPVGIGLSFFKNAADPVLTFKSRYLLLDDDDYRIISQRTNAPQLTHLADTSIGRLYLNQSTDCPKGGA